jgi:hypothetical protein
MCEQSGAMQGQQGPAARGYRMASVAPLMQGLQAGIQRSLGLYQSGGIVRVRTRCDWGGKNVMSAYVLLFPKYRVFLKKRSGYNCIQWPNCAANITAFCVSCDVLCLRRWQCHERAVIKMAYKIEQRVLSVNISDYALPCITRFWNQGGGIITLQGDDKCIKKCNRKFRGGVIGDKSQN